MASLTFFSIKRILRGRLVLPALLALPLGAGIAAASLHSPALQWTAIGAAAAAAILLVYLQHRLDDASGLAQAIASTPVGRSGYKAASATVAAGIFAVQILLLILPGLLS